jgi:hypothetical protein
MAENFMNVPKTKSRVSRLSASWWTIDRSVLSATFSMMLPELINLFSRGNFEVQINGLMRKYDWAKAGMNQTWYQMELWEDQCSDFSGCAIQRLLFFSLELYGFRNPSRTKTDCVCIARCKVDVLFSCHYLNGLRIMITGLVTQRSIYACFRVKCISADIHRLFWKGLEWISQSE